MAVRTANEISGNIVAMLGAQSPEGLAEILEDIADSVGTTDMSGYVSKAEYDNVVADRDKYSNQAKDYMDRYINRFYKSYSTENDTGIIDSGVTQGTIEKDEKDVAYVDLFE